MDRDQNRMVEKMLGLDGVAVVGMDDSGVELVIWIETKRASAVCGTCGVKAVVKDRHDVRLVGLPAFGRPTVLVWRKRRWRCPDAGCEVKTWTEKDQSISFPRQNLSTRAGLWATVQVGRFGRTVNEVAAELGADWHTINDTVCGYGAALLEADCGRVGDVCSVGLDETLFMREGRYKTRRWATSIVDVSHGRLLDVVAGRDAAAACGWFADQGEQWCENVEWASLDMSGPYKKVFDTVVPDAVQVVDWFHVVKHANSKVDECRRRVQNQTLGHRGRKGDPLYRIRRRLNRACENLSESDQRKLELLCRSGDSSGEVFFAWHAKEGIRDLYNQEDLAAAERYLDELVEILADPGFGPEIRSLAKTLKRWGRLIINWYKAKISNGRLSTPTGAANNLIKRVKRVGFGFRNFGNYRTRVLLYVGKPNWDLLPTITPR